MIAFWNISNGPVPTENEMNDMESSDARTGGPISSRGQERQG
jgi:hypothetical protein